jgi:hypothetical protein
LGLIPVVIVYLLFQSYQLIGTSLVLVILAVFILRGPGELEISDQLFQWQEKQDSDTLTIGDLAYASISQKTIESWTRKLLIIGFISIGLAPWGESILPDLAYVFALFIGYVYANIFIPVSIFSMPMALIIFFLIGPLILSLGILGARTAYQKTKEESEGLTF